MVMSTKSIGVDGDMGVSMGTGRLEGMGIWVCQRGQGVNGDRGSTGAWRTPDGRQGDLRGCVGH